MWREPSGRREEIAARTSVPSSYVVRERTFPGTQIGVGLFLFVTLVYLLFGQLNNDEAWYLYAARLAVQGSIPYRDFVFPQMPLLAYVYGVPQILFPSLVLGRLTSIVLSIGTLAMSIVVAKRYGGARAAALVAVLTALYTAGLYYDTIVKTYALVAFFFTGTLFFLASDRPDSQKYTAAVAFALLAVLARVTAFFFLVPILLYVLLTTSIKTRLAVLVETAVTAAVAAWFLLPDWKTASWNLFSSHLQHWGDMGAIDRFREILTTRLPDLAQNLGPLLVLMLPALYLVWITRDSAAWPRRPIPLLITGIGMLLFALSHFANGLWELEYLVPGAVAFLPILAIVLVRLFDGADAISRTFMAAVLVTAVVLLLFVENIQHLNERAGRFPLQQVNDVAAFLDQRSSPSDKVMALEALAVPYQADRQPLPDMTLAQFSLQPVDDVTAAQLHVVNYGQIATYLEQKTARFVALTDGDWDMLAANATQDSPDLHKIMDSNYTEILQVPEYGQFVLTLHVYQAQ